MSPGLPPNQSYVLPVSGWMPSTTTCWPVAEELEPLPVAAVGSEDGHANLGKWGIGPERNCAFWRAAEANKNISPFLEAFAHHGFDRRGGIGIEDVNVEAWY